MRRRLKCSRSWLTSLAIGPEARPATATEFVPNDFSDFVGISSWIRDSESYFSPKPWLSQVDDVSRRQIQAGGPIAGVVVPDSGLATIHLVEDDS